MMGIVKPAAASPILPKKLPIIIPFRIIPNIVNTTENTVPIKKFLKTEETEVTELTEKTMY